MYLRACEQNHCMPFDFYMLLGHTIYMEGTTTGAPVVETPTSQSTEAVVQATLSVKTPIENPRSFLENQAASAGNQSEVKMNISPNFSTEGVGGMSKSVEMQQQRGEFAKKIAESPFGKAVREEAKSSKWKWVGLADEAAMIATFALSAALGAPPSIEDQAAYKPTHIYQNSEEQIPPNWQHKESARLTTPAAGESPPDKSLGNNINSSQEAVAAESFVPSGQLASQLDKTA